MMQTEEQKARVIKTLLIGNHRGQAGDSVEWHRTFCELYGLNYGHHIYGEVLDEMTRTQQAEVADRVYFPRYMIS